MQRDRAPRHIPRSRAMATPSSHVSGSKPAMPTMRLSCADNRQGNGRTENPTTPSDHRHHHHGHQRAHQLHQAHHDREVRAMPHGRRFRHSRHRLVVRRRRICCSAGNRSTALLGTAPRTRSSSACWFHSFEYAPSSRTRSCSCGAAARQRARRKARRCSRRPQPAAKRCEIMMTVRRLRQLMDNADDGLFAFGIHVRRGLVEDVDGSIVQKRAGQAPNAGAARRKGCRPAR